MKSLKEEDLGVFCLKIIQPEGVYKVGTDSILLASFAARKLRPSSVCADLCCGGGIITLLCAARGARRCVGVDIDDIAIATAKKNAEINGFELEFLLSDIKEPIFQTGSFDLVTANPPYFTSRSKESPVERRRIARSDAICSFGDVARAASRLLRFGGDFFAVYRPERVCDVMCEMREAGIEPKTVCLAAHRAAAAPFALLVHGKKGAERGAVFEPGIFMDSERAREIYLGKPM